jgi:DNA-binding MarR family transcriptional regulator
MRLIWAIDHGLHKVSKRMARTLGATAPQRLVVRLLGRFPGLTVAGLAESMHLDISTVSVVLKKLEARRLVTRRIDPLDRRRARLGLTPRGRALGVEGSGTVEAAVQRTLGRLPARKIDHAREVLADLAASLGDMEVGAQDRRGRRVR